MSTFIPSPRLRASARWHGLRVGLLGGSFDPAHAGHMHIAKQALQRFRLDAVWWVVSPGNPLKTRDAVRDYAARLEAVDAFIDHPRMVASDIERQMGTRYTADTLEGLRRHFPRTAFIWIAGMDNADGFDRWAKWRDLPQVVPFVFFDRPPVAAKLKRKRVRQDRRIRQCIMQGRHWLERQDTGVFWVFSGRAVDLSSTRLRG